MVRWTLVRGLLAALIVLSTVPLSLGLSASFGDFSAHAQGVIQNIQVEGNKRVEPETVRSYLTFSVGDTYDPAQDRRVAQGAVCHRPVPGRAHPTGRVDHRHRHRREPDREPGRLRGQQGDRGRHPCLGGAAQGARGLYPRPRAEPTCSAFSTSIAAKACMPLRSIPRSSISTPTASMWCSRSTRESPPRCAPSTSSAIRRSAIRNFAS